MERLQDKCLGIFSTLTGKSIIFGSIKTYLVMKGIEHSKHTNLSQSDGYSQWFVC